MRYLILEIGGFFGFFLIMALFIKAINQIFFKQELSDLVFKNFQAAKYSLEDVVSYEELIRMKLFISRLKQNSGIKQLLKSDPKTAEMLSDDDQGGDTSTMGGYDLENHQMIDLRSDKDNSSIALAQS